VKVQIITPGKIIDSTIVRAASREEWGPLLAAGIEMAEYQPTMFHVKALVVDDLLVSVGSTNFDNRSFSLNDEANLNVLNAAFAKQQSKVFDDDWARAKPVTYASWDRRPVTAKVMGKLASIVGSQL
jgi:cardiolipin synthase